jgi:hypothetical protein
MPQGTPLRFVLPFISGLKSPEFSGSFYKIGNTRIILNNIGIIYLSNGFYPPIKLSHLSIFTTSDSLRNSSYTFQINNAFI